jgi:hypothetical protein
MFYVNYTMMHGSTYITMPNKFVTRAKMEYETKCNIYLMCEGFESKNFALLVLQVIDL